MGAFSVEAAGHRSDLSLPLDECVGGEDGVALGAVLQLRVQPGDLPSVGLPEEMGVDLPREKLVMHVARLAPPFVFVNFRYPSGL